MASQSSFNHRFNQWGRRRLLMQRIAYLWLAGCFHLLAMDPAGLASAAFPTPTDERDHAAADVVSPTAGVPPVSASMAIIAGGRDADALPAAWYRGVCCLLLIAGGVIARMAKALPHHGNRLADPAAGDCRVKQIAECIDDVFWVGTADYSRLEYVNSAYETIWGRSCESLYADPLSWTGGLFPHDRAPIMDAIARQRAADTATGAFPDFRIVTPDGAVRWIRARSFDVNPMDADERRMVILFQDITRSKFFEASLRESDGKWRSLTENSPDHIMLTDLDGHIFFANRSFMGLETADLAGKSLKQLISGTYAPVVAACLKTVVDNGRSDACQVESRSSGGQSLIFELRMGPVTVNDQIVAVAVNSTEITTRVAQEKALQESEAFHRTLFNDAPTGMCIQDFSAAESFARQLARTGVTDLKQYLMAHPGEVSRLAEQVRVVKVNQAMVDLYHADGEAMILGPVSRFLKENDHQHFIDQVVALAGGEDRFTSEARNLDIAGHTLHLIIRKVVVRRAENGLSKVLTSLVDVTPIRDAEKERERLLLQLQQAQKMEAIGTLAGGVAHDFNNILGIILGNVDLAMADMPKDDPAFHNLLEIESAVSRAREIVIQLLGLSRNSAIAQTAMHLVPVIEEAVKFLRVTIPANIDIHTDLSVEHDVICAHSTQIHQIMINLFTNAAHAMEDRGGRLDVQVKNVDVDATMPGVFNSIPPGSYVCLTVGDTGTGIGDDIKARIFDPYFTTKDTGKGTGMGLCMVQGIMQNSGGGIVMDTMPGAGTRFALYFPRSDMTANAESRTEMDIPGGSEHILFVDDEALIVDLSVKMLERLGYRVTSSTDAADAISLFSADPSVYDLVVTDMAMPGLTGCQLIERIRQARRTLPVILCSGNLERISSEQVERLAISNVLAKPLSLRGLALAVRHTLDLPRQPAG